MIHALWHAATFAVAALVAFTSCTTDDTPAWVPSGYAPCVTEDAPGPCYWDAQHMGNGQGTSFHVDADDIITYIYE